MNSSNSLNEAIYNKKILNILKILILLIALFVNKNVYEFMINQENILKIFIIIILALCVIQFLKIKKIIWYKNRLNLPIFLFILVMSISLLRVSTLGVVLRDYEIFISYFLLYFLILNNVNSGKQFDSFIKLFFSIFLIVAVYMHISEGSGHCFR